LYSAHIFTQIAFPAVSMYDVDLNQRSTYLGTTFQTRK
jgi:hypothetical protein